MKYILTLALAAMCSTAFAQTTVGNVTITRPSDVKNITPLTRTTPTTSTPAVARATAPADLPEGWRYLTGRIVAPSHVRLPTGSKVQVSIVEVDRQQRHRATHLDIGFDTSALSTPYNIQYNPARMNNSENIYLLRAKVFDAQGDLLYMTKNPVAVPRSRAAKLNIPVSRY